MRLDRRRSGIAMAVLLLAAGIATPATRPPRRSLVVRDLGTFDGGTATAIALNDQGQAVGVGVTGGVLSPFLWDAGRWFDIGPGIPVDINNAGQVLLQTQADVPEQENACYLLQGAALTDMQVPAGWQCHAADLNEAGQAVGALSIIAGTQYIERAFLWSDGAFTDLGTLGGDLTVAFALNGRGQVVGGAMTPSGYQHSFLWEAGTMTDLGAPGAPWSRATAINDRGQVVMESGAHLYLWEAGVMRDLGTMGAPDTPSQRTVALDLNERGQVLVAVEDAPAHVFRYGIWSNGRLVPLPSLGGGRPSAVALNDLGQAIGNDRTDDASVWHLALFTTVVTRGNRNR